jgi:PAS domain-containing protein
MSDKTQENNFSIKTSIFYKLLVPVVLMVSVAVGISTYYSVKSESRALTEGLIHTATNMVDNIASSAQNAFWSLNWIYVEKQLHKYHQRKGDMLIYAKLVKHDGEVYLADKKEYYGDHVDSSLFLNKETLFENHLFTETNERGILFVEPVEIGNDTWYVMLGISLRSIEASIDLLIFRNLTLGAIIVLLGAIISFFMFRSISRPIINLANTVKFISDGDFNHKVTVTSTDEAGLLGRSFNQMMDKLNLAREEEHKNKREIEEKNISLEQEIEERRQAQEALQQSEEKYRNILESIQEGYFEVDLAGSITFFNKAFERMSGYPGDELYGINNRDITTHETSQKMYKIFNKICH